MFATGKSRFYWYSWVLEITYLRVAVGFAVKKMSLVFGSKSVIRCVQLLNAESRQAI